jgi:hypothetical protein
MTLVLAHIEINKIDESHIAKVKIPTEEKAVIPYKDWKKEQRTSIVYKLPIEYCKFRVENGRIATEITTYETTKGPLDPNAETTQQIISNFLSKSDTQNNEILKKSLSRDGQRDPAVITADGFLINGNRRKWALQELNKNHPNEKFKYLKVVILPGSDDPEKPTFSDLALMENDYQLYSDGRSDYSSMNKILNLFQKVEKGIELEDMLRQDPSYSGLNIKEFNKSVKNFKKKYFRPLELMNEYLIENKIKNNFVKVQDKWTAFQDLSERVIDQIENNERGLIEYQINENEIGLIKAAAFNIIKLRNHEEVDQRTHKLMARMLKWVEVDKNEVLKIGKIGDPYQDVQNTEERFDKWNDEFNDKIVSSIKKLDSLAQRKKEIEGPINRLEDILQKIKHDELSYDQLTRMRSADVPSARQLANYIQTASTQLTKLLYSIETDDKKALAELKRIYSKKQDN